MKRVTILLFVLLAAGFVRGDVNVSREQDPVVVNAKTIALRLENSRVRVFDATLKPGEKENLHSHPAYVVYVIEGGKIRNHLPDGKVTDAEYKPGDVFFRDPLIHWAENVGSTTLRLVVVELKN